MADILKSVQKISSEHQSIRQHIKLAGDTVNDIDAMITLQKVSSEWTQSSLEELVNKQQQLQQALSLLEHGLKNHFALEEETLPPVLGKFLTKALISEHRNISKQIENAKAVLGEGGLEKLEQPELLEKKSVIREVVNKLYNTLETHANHEEVLFMMIKKGLENS